MNRPTLDQAIPVIIGTFAGMLSGLGLRATSFESLIIGTWVWLMHQATQWLLLFRNHYKQKFIEGELQNGILDALRDLKLRTPEQSSNKE